MSMQPGSLFGLELCMSTGKHAALQPFYILLLKTA